jgi:hypothetical protein
LDDAVLTDSNGLKVSFKNTVWKVWQMIAGCSSL